MSSQAGKGDQPRPVDRGRFNQNFDQIKGMGTTKLEPKRGRRFVKVYGKPDPGKKVTKFVEIPPGTHVAAPFEGLRDLITRAVGIPSK